MEPETLKLIYAVVKDFGFPAVVAVYVLTRLSGELARQTREIHKLVLLLVARDGKVPPELLQN
jgi:hypothetical protein